MVTLLAAVAVKLTVVILLMWLKVAVICADPTCVDLMVADAFPLTSVTALVLPASRFCGVMISPGRLDVKSIRAPKTFPPSGLVTCAVIVAVATPFASTGDPVTLNDISFNIKTQLFVGETVPPIHEAPAPTVDDTGLGTQPVTPRILLFINIDFMVVPLEFVN